MAVARHRSFRKAADELEMASSTISHLMTGLEGRLGTRLLNRTTRSVAPTQAGERLIDRLAPVLRDLDQALLEVDSQRDRPSGTLRLTASETVVSLLLGAVVPEFQRRYPDVRLDIVAQPAFVDIVEDGFDAGFRLGDAVPLDMIAVRFGPPSRMIPVASPAYLEGRPTPDTPDDLKHHECIGSRTPAGRPYRWEFEHQGQALEVDVAGKLVLNRTELILKAALQGMGIGFVPERIAAEYLSDGRLTALLPQWCPQYPGLYLYYPGRRHVPAGLRAFIDVLKSVSDGKLDK